MNVVPWRRFSDERAETSRAETTTMKDFYQEPYEFGVLEAKCVTARSLNDTDFKTATQHLRYSRALARLKPKSPTFADRLAITADDLWRDQAIVRYMPEFMAWLGHKPSDWTAVEISDKQRMLYKNKYMARSGKMFFGRAEKIRLRQGGDGPTRYRVPAHRRLVNKWRVKFGKLRN